MGNIYNIAEVGIRLKKSISIFKYEFINLKRSKIFWISIVLYLIGYQQVFSAFIRHFNLYGGLVSLIRLSWLPMNFIMIPLLIIASEIGRDRVEVFETLDIKPAEKMLGKAISVLTMAGIFLTINFLVTGGMAIVVKASLPYFLYLMTGHAVNSIITLLALCFTGLLIGESLGHINSGILRFLVILVFFIMICSFYKISSTLLTLYNTPIFGSSFNFFRFDEYFIYHKLFWLATTGAAALGIYVIEYKISYKRISLAPVAVIVLFLAAAVLSFSKGGEYKPVYYEVIPNTSATTDSLRKTPYEVYQAKQNPGYKVSSYYMDMNLSRRFSNKCSMAIFITEDGVKDLTFGLYGKLSIKNVFLAEKPVAFKRDNVSFTVNLPQEMKKGDIVGLNVNYEGVINTVWQQGSTLFFSDNKASFLAETFEWYPKLNDGIEKDYNIRLKHDNKIYSNLNISKSSEYYKLAGRDKEIFILSGNIAEKNYNGFKLVGNEEYFKEESQCENAIETAQKAPEVSGKTRGDSFKTIIYAPFIPSNGRVFTYKGVYLNTNTDKNDGISTKR